MNHRKFHPGTFCRIALVAFFALCLLCPLFGQTTQAAQGIKVALLLESGASDHGAADMMRKGLADAQAKAGGRVAAEILVVPPDSDQTAAFRQAAATHDLVIVAEPRLHAVLRDNAANFRRTMFGCVDTGVRATNIMSVTFADPQACFLAGAASALMLSKEAKLGWIEAEQTPPGDSMLQGFAYGATLSRRGTKVEVRQTGYDALAAGEAVRDLSRSGCAIIGVAASYASKGCYNAAGTSPALLIGMDTDQSSMAPSRVVFSVVKRYDTAVARIVSSAASGHFEGGEIIEYELKDGGVDLKISDRFLKEGRIPKHVLTRLRELRKEVLDGNIQLEDKRIPTYCKSCIIR